MVALDIFLWMLVGLVIYIIRMRIRLDILSKEQVRELYRDPLVIFEALLHIILWPYTLACLIFNSIKWVISAFLNLVVNIIAACASKLFGR